MKLFKRENYLSKIRGFYHTNDIIKVITGIRRCGKSSLMQMIADEIIESGVNKENIIYINLDKKGFKSIKKADELENLIDSLSNVKGNRYLFIDEIQNVENFEEVINAYREEDEYSIFITGSNSYLLSGELITKLTGRYIEFEMFPLTFEEYLGMKEFYKYDINSNLLIELNNYIIEGGFPRTMFFDDLNDKRTYVKGIVEEIFKKDIKSRCVIRKKETFDLVMNYIINNFGCTTSINNILENLNKSGLGISKTTLLRYIKWFEESYLLNSVLRFDIKGRQYIGSPFKIYFEDVGIRNAILNFRDVDETQIIENIVYNELRYRGYKVDVGIVTIKENTNRLDKNGRLIYADTDTEVDFVANKSGKIYYIQVALAIPNEEKKEQEYKSIRNIPDSFKKIIVVKEEGKHYYTEEGFLRISLLDFLLNKDSLDI